MKLRLLLLVAALCLCVVATVVHAAGNARGYVQIYTNPVTGEVKFTYTITVNLTAISTGEVNFWKALADYVSKNRSGIMSVLTKYISSYLTKNMKYSNATFRVLYLDVKVLNSTSSSIYFKIFLFARVGIPITRTWLETVVNVKFRYMCPNMSIPEVTIAGKPLNPATMLFLCFKDFDVPLDVWSHHFNGTHTIFRLEKNVTMTTPYNTLVSTWLRYDVVSIGYASGIDDEVHFSNIPLWIIGFIAALFLLAILSTIFAARRRAEVSEVEYA